MIVENCLPEIVFQHYVLCFNLMIDIPYRKNFSRSAQKSDFLEFLLHKVLKTLNRSASSNKGFTVPLQN